MATGDILAVRIASATAHNGFVAEIDIDNLATGGTYAFGLGTNNAPSGAKIVFTVTSSGYDATGAATSIVRTVYGTQWMRKASPNEATADESVAGSTLTVRVTLSDFIYSGDTATVTIGSGFYTKTAVPNNATTALSVTNNSTLAHPKCIARWAWPGFETVTADFLLEAVCFHRSSLNGKPVAAVIFTVTDGTNTVTQTVTAMTVSTRTGDANTVLVYATTIPITSFTQGAVLTANFTAYPWVGDFGAVLDSNNGITPPDERLCPLKLLCDKNSTYGGGVAVVDATNGHNSTANTWVAASQASAETAYTSSTANSYTTIGNAVQAIKSYNNANLSRNNPSGGVILLTGNHSMPGTGPSDQGAQDAWLTITRLSSVSRATANINAGSGVSLNTRRIKLYDITLSGNSTITFTADATDGVIWADSCAVNMTGVAAFYTWRLCYATRNTVTAIDSGFINYSTEKGAFALVRGNTGPTTAAGAGIIGHMYAFLGNRNMRPWWVHTGRNPGTLAVADNAVIAYNTHYGFNDTAAWVDTASTGANIVGLALVQNVLEIVIDSVLLQVHADTVSGTSDHVVLWHNTLAGARLNIAYNEAGSTPYLHKNYSQRNNLFDDWNNKDDTFPTANAARTGAWPVGHAIGSRGNFLRKSTFPGEFDGLNTMRATGTYAYVADASYNNGGGGSAAGNGDYRLGLTASGYTLAPNAVLPFDIAGTVRQLSGGSAGAYEMVVNAVSGYLLVAN